jgi:hypothetical protein
VPAIGTPADILRFFFNMCLLACSFLCVVLLHILRWQVPKSTPATAENGLIPKKLRENNGQWLLWPTIAQTLI